MSDAVAVGTEPELGTETETETRRPSRVVVYGIVLVTALLVWWLARTDAPLPGFLESVVENKRESTPPAAIALRQGMPERSEEHTSELQSLMRISYAVFCLKQKKKNNE